MDKQDAFLLALIVVAVFVYLIRKRSASANERSRLTEEERIRRREQALKRFATDGGLSSTTTTTTTTTTARDSAAAVSIEAETQDISRAAAATTTTRTSSERQLRNRKPQTTARAAEKKKKPKSARPLPPEARRDVIANATASRIPTRLGQETPPPSSASQQHPVIAKKDDPPSPSADARETRIQSNGTQEKTVSAIEAASTAPIQISIEEEHHANEAAPTPMVSMGEENTDETEPVTENATATLPTKPKKIEPPAQILCDALSTVTGLTVAVQPGEGTWGGQQWKKKRRYSKRPKASAAGSIEEGNIDLPLLQYQNSNKDEGWDSLKEAWQSILESSLSSDCFHSHLFPSNKADRHGNITTNTPTHKKNALQGAVAWHTLTRTVVRDCTFSCEDDKLHLKACMELFGRYITDRCVELMRVEIEKMTAEKDDDDEEFEVDGLFSDNYIGELGSAAPTKESKQTGLFSDLMSLLTEAETVVTKAFLSDLMTSFSGFGAANDRDSSKNGIPDLAETMLQESLTRVPSVHNRPKAVAGNDIYRSLTLMSNLFTLSPDLARALLSRIESELYSVSVSADVDVSARAFEEKAALGKLLSLAAYTVPGAGSEEVRPQQEGRRLSQFQHLLRSVENYPLCAFFVRGPKTVAIDAVLSDSKRTMGVARNTGTLVLRRTMIAGNKDTADDRKRLLFQWISIIIKKNDALVGLLSSELLSADSPQKLCSTRSFLLGAASIILDLCSQSLVDRFEKLAAAAFDPLYLVHSSSNDHHRDPGMLCIAHDERRLFSSGKDSAQILQMTRTSFSAPDRFSGSTEFFFLAAALLRVSLFPGLRARQELMVERSGIFSQLRQLAKRVADGNQNVQINRAAYDHSSLSTDALLGWATFLEDADLVAKLTSFSLLQLRWLVAVSNRSLSGNNVGKSVSKEYSVDTLPAFAVIPEWLCKLPAQWIAHVAVQAPGSLKQYEAEAAVEYATKLLQTCNPNATTHESQLSPPVITELVRIPGAFVRAGVDRARRRYVSAMMRRRAQAAEEEMEEMFDERDLDIYTSFDADDLGVTAFTNKFVLEHLGSTLTSIFRALDAEEGMDVEREHNYDKFQVKGEVTDLLLRLLSHPSGAAKASIVNLPDESIASFASSVAASLGMLLDDACHKLTDARDILKGQRSRFSRPVDKRYYEFLAKHTASSLASSRRFLLLLCKLSEDDKLASIFGGSASSRTSVPSDLASMFVNFLGRLTDEDGGTNGLLDFRDTPTSTAVLLEDLSGVDSQELESELTNLLRARRFASDEYGLDVSILTHQFLSLAARWHLAAATASSDARKSSLFLETVASAEDCRIEHLRSVLTRLIGSCDGDNAEVVLQADGYVDFSLWEDKFDIKSQSLDSNRDRRWFAKQNQTTHSQIDKIASYDDISRFIDDLEAARAKTAEAGAGDLSEEAIEKLEECIIRNYNYMALESYTEHLGDWVVSSQSFLSSSGDGKFAHFYDATARKRSSESIGSGKIMIKEARKCQRNLPKPHPNASIFVCFAEERMDLCRAIVTGTADTPYSFGLFEFDVYFPVMYPSAPPLVTFKTTGGGQIRFSPNLYTDGKVCISLLGTARAWNEGQRWNAEQSSLAQVLLSIQTQILGVPDPYFSEGFGHEGMRGTDAGEKGSVRYNHSLRLATLRLAIIDQLKSPPLGFEDVVQRHFSMCRKRLLVQARRWMMDAKGTPIYKRFGRAYRELVTLLSSDKLTFQSDRNEVLPPSKDDLQALETLYPVFVREAKDDQSDSRKPAAAVSNERAANLAPERSGGEAVAGGFHNPWAALDQVEEVARHHQPSEADVDDDEEDFYS